MFISVELVHNSQSEATICVFPRFYQLLFIKETSIKQLTVFELLQWAHHQTLVLFVKQWFIYLYLLFLPFYSIFLPAPSPTLLPARHFRLPVERAFRFSRSVVVPTGFNSRAVKVGRPEGPLLPKYSRVAWDRGNRTADARPSYRQITIRYNSLTRVRFSPCSIFVSCSVCGEQYRRVGRRRRRGTYTRTHTPPEHDPRQRSFWWVQLLPKIKWRGYV